MLLTNYFDHWYPYSFASANYLAVKMTLLQKQLKVISILIKSLYRLEKARKDISLRPVTTDELTFKYGVFRKRRQIDQH